MDRSNASLHAGKRHKQIRWLVYQTILLVCCCAIVSFSTPAFSQSNQSILLVVFKEDRHSITSAFRKIIKGIEKHSDLNVVEQILRNPLNTDDINGLINTYQAKAIVVLGSKAMKLFENAQVSVPIISGGTLYPSKTKHDVYGLSLTPAPSLLFQRLQNVAPRIRKIHVVYNPDKYQWLINLANDAADESHLKLITYEANNLRSSAKTHRQIVKKINPANEAIWLLQDSQLVGDKNVLPYLLKEAWQRELVIFSSNPQHVRRGALLSLYSERELSGEELGLLAKNVLDNTAKLQQQFMPSHRVKSTVNIRSAGHLGIRFNSEQLRSFDLIFPKR